MDHDSDVINAVNPYRLNVFFKNKILYFPNIEHNVTAVLYSGLF